MLATPLGNQKHPSLKVIINSLGEPSCAYQQEMQLWRGHQQVEAAERFIMSRVNERYTHKEIPATPIFLSHYARYLATFLLLGLALGSGPTWT